MTTADKSAAFGRLWTRFFPRHEQPSPQYRFCPSRRWRCDWAFIAAKVIVEIEGGLWVHGRHSRGSGVKSDIERANWMVCNGWRLLRYTTDDLTSRPVQVCEEVAGLLERKP